MGVTPRKIDVTLKKTLEFSSGLIKINEFNFFNF